MTLNRQTLSSIPGSSRASRRLTHLVLNLRPAFRTGDTHNDGKPMSQDRRQIDRARGRAYREWDETGSFEEYWAKNRQRYLAQAKTDIRSPSRPHARTTSAKMRKCPKGHMVARNMTHCPTCYPHLARVKGKATPDQMISDGNSIMKAGLSVTASMILLPIVAVILIVVFSLMKTVLSA